MTLLKRYDIQWLRALAILAVLGFHIWPEIFPYGFLGVDIFFVISGYLMTQILILNKTETHYLFYSKRIKRIFPTCLLIITIFAVLGYFLLIPSDFASLKKEALWSIFFVNNFSSMFKEKKYFELVSGFSFFLHTWSLAVEIQFYFIAPFLIRFLYSKRQPIIYILIFISASAFLHFISSETISFGLMFCRIWQFLIGTLAFCGFQKSDERNSENYVSTKKYQIFNFNYFNNSAFTSFFCLFCIILICFNSFQIIISFKFLSSIFRVSITLISGLFIYLNSCQSLKLPKILNVLIVYIGDASYSIYLIHWPFLMFLKYYSMPFQSIYALFAIFGISILIHEGFEKFMGRKSWKLNAWFLSICYIIILGLCLINNSKQQHSNFKEPQAFNPVLDNEKEAQSCGIFYSGCEKNEMIENHLKIRPASDLLDRYCSFKFASKSSNQQTILISGNSHIFFQINGILKAINESKTKFSEAYVITHPGCSLMIGKLNEKMKHCKNFRDSHDEFLNILKPNFIIHNARVDHFPGLHNATLITKNFTGDEIYEEIKKAMLRISTFTQRLIIIEPTPILNTNYLNPSTLAHAFLTNDAPKQFDLSLEKHHQRHSPLWIRMKEAAKHCSNCILIPTEKLFCTNEICPAYDLNTKLARYCDNVHITPRASLNLVPALINALENKAFNLK